MLDGGVFSRQAEGIPADGVQHIEALHAFGPGQHIAYGVVANVSHMEVAGRVWEHFQDVVLFFAGIVLAGKGVGLLPAFLPFLFNFLGIVALHGVMDSKICLAGGIFLSGL